MSTAKHYCLTTGKTTGFYWACNKSLGPNIIIKATNCYDLATIMKFYLILHLLYTMKNINYLSLHFDNRSV